MISGFKIFFEVVVDYWFIIQLFSVGLATEICL